MMRVAPLFETLDDLDNSTKTMQALLGNEWYRNHIKGIQEVMIGCAPQRAGPDVLSVGDLARSCDVSILILGVQVLRLWQGRRPHGRRLGPVRGAGKPGGCCQGAAGWTFYAHKQAA
jgi:Phosphoenolpyruvate carboxylase